MVECPTCGKVTDTEQGMKIHHATIHDESLVQNEWECQWCADTFYRPESQVPNPNNTFCSNECKGKWMDGEVNESIRTTVECEWCGDEFTRRVVEIEPRNNLFCSHKCHGLWKSEQWTVTVSCSTCGAEVKKTASQAEGIEHHFCSKRCQGDWYSENIVGENHPLWKPSATPYYGEDWPQQRQKSLERDSYQCQDCGMSREEHYDEYGYDLEVHHKTPIRTFSDTSEANRLSNLITVCTSCHMEREASIDVEV